MGAEHWDAQLGSVADEASRLLESLRRSAAEAAATAADDAAAPADHATEHTAPGDTAAEEPAGGDGGREHACPRGSEHDPVCQWCPICRGAAVVRSLSPQTLTRFADLASLAATVLADLARARADTGPSGPGAAGGTGSARPPAARPATSRPIPVRDADDPQEDPRG